MNRNRLLVIAAMLCVAALLPAGAYAQSPQTANLTVTASVSANCRLTAGALPFGAYDPVVTNAATDLNGSGTFTVACTRNAPGVWIGLGNGLNYTTTRRMRIGATAEYLDYALYQDAAFTTPWLNVIPPGGGVSYSPASRAPFTMTVYGRVPGAQDVAVGSYTDTVVISVNF